MIDRTQVRNLHRGGYDPANPDHVYVGRQNGRWRLKRSAYANPFKVGRDGTNEECVEQYRKWLLEQPELVERAKRELRGKVLWCWCVPEQRCHAEVLVEVVEAA